MSLKKWYAKWSDNVDMYMYDNFSEVEMNILKGYVLMKYAFDM